MPPQALLLRYLADVTYVCHYPILYLKWDEGLRLMSPRLNSLGSYPVRATHLVDAQLGDTPFIEIHLCPAARLQHCHQSRMVELLEHKGCTNLVLRFAAMCSALAPCMLISPSLNDQDGRGRWIFDGRCYRHVYTRHLNGGTRHCQLTVRDHQVFACGSPTYIVKQPDL